MNNAALAHNVASMAEDIVKWTKGRIGDTTIALLISDAVANFGIKTSRLAVSNQVVLHTKKKAGIPDIIIQL